jgi:hypothetical protein
VTAPITTGPVAANPATTEPATSAAEVTADPATPPLSLGQPPFRELPRASSAGLSGAGVGGTSGGSGTLMFVLWPDSPIMTSGFISRFLQFGTSVEASTVSSSDATGSAGATSSSSARADGGRTFSGEPSATDPGWGFGSPIGRFAVTGSGVLIAGSDDGSASVRLVVPGVVVALAALIGAAAVLAQRRVERRRRTIV